jgi:hypothetical protein
MIGESTDDPAAAVAALAGAGDVSTSRWHTGTGTRETSVAGVWSDFLPSVSGSLAGGMQHQQQHSGDHQSGDEHEHSTDHGALP